MNLGENFRKLRAVKGLTQEQLAEVFGVSPQAISRWEIGSTYPDITMLPMIANYFGVTLDELLGMDEIASRQRLDEYYKTWQKNNVGGKRSEKDAENAALMREALKIFPNDALLLVQLSTSLEKLGETDEEKKKYLRESIAVQEQILQCTTDSEVRNAVQYNICFAYWKNGDKEKAIEKAKKLPNLYKARENALVRFSEGKDKTAVSEEALERIAWVLHFHLSSMADGDCSDADRRKILQKIKPIFEILFDGNYSNMVEGLIEETNEQINGLR